MQYFIGILLIVEFINVYNLRTLTIMESINVMIDDALVHTDDKLDEDYDSYSATYRDIEKKKNEKRDRASDPNGESYRVFWNQSRTISQSKVEPSIRSSN